MSSRLVGKLALITGAAGGIGSAIAHLFAREGATVLVNDLHPQAAEIVVQEIIEQGGSAFSTPFDIADSAQVREAFEAIDERHGGIDILVNNAFAAFRDVALHELAEADWDRTLAVSLKGPFLCTQKALPLMRRRGGGSLVWLSSVNALFGVGEPAYTAAKGGIVSLARLVASEYASWNIRSNVICPGTVATGICLDHWSQFPVGFAKLKEMYPLGRIGQPEEIAQAALYLASAESSFVTGAVHVVDGGLLAGRKLELA